jgi:hypothetical protein
MTFFIVAWRHQNRNLQMTIQVQGCQMAYFLPNTQILVYFGGPLKVKCCHLTAIWCIVGSFGRFCGHLVYFPPF